MAPQETSTRARQDSGLIDLIAIDREARERNAAREAEEARARSEVPPVMHDLSAAEDDVDAFAQSMATPWSRLAKLDRRSKIAAAAGAALLAIDGAPGQHSAATARHARSGPRGRIAGEERHRDPGRSDRQDEGQEAGGERPAEELGQGRPRTEADEGAELRGMIVVDVGDCDS